MRSSSAKNGIMENATYVSECPCCGRLPDGVHTGLGFDHLKCVVFCGNEILDRFTETEADVVYILLRAWPEMVSIDQMIDGLYGSSINDIQDPRSTVRQYVFRVKHRLAKLGIKINNVHGQGWYLTKAEE